VVVRIDVQDEYGVRVTDAAVAVEGKETVTFAVEAVLRVGGHAEEPVATIELLAVRIVVLVDGTIVVTELDADAELL